MSSRKRNCGGLNTSSPSKVQKSSISDTIILNQNEMSSVEVMETPDKSENDKKLYRVIRLENGLKALLISDPNQNPVPHDDTDDGHTHKHKREAVVSSDEEEESDEEDDMGKHAAEEESDDDDAGGGAHHEKRGKLAACSLCVDVGSFSDPRDVQGLAHFLGKIDSLIYSMKNRIIFP